ncbi:MAG: IS3 family transposase, partial [Acetobacteraceae bacterium]|nr:IS3 family transposase [Acetobacteraceae bacterium]
LLTIDRPGQVWAADITYIPMARGFLYLVVVMDWYSRYVLAWRLSNTMDTGFCVAALQDALRKGRPEIFNTDLGAQFTSAAFTDKLETAGIRISMDGRGRWLDNVFVERRWRSLKYEEVHLKAYSNGLEARIGIGQLFRFYNERRLHQALGYKTPAAAWAAEVSPVDLPLRLTTLARRPQLHRANNSKTWYISDEEEERPSPYQPTPVVLSLRSTVVIPIGAPDKEMAPGTLEPEYWPGLHTVRNPTLILDDICRTKHDDRISLRRTPVNAAIATIG